MVRPGRRAGGLLVGAVLLFAVGTNVQSGWVLTLAALLLGATITGLILPMRMIRGIDVERRGPAVASAGQAVRVELVVRNRSRRSKLSLVLEDPFVAPASAFVPALAAKETVRVDTSRAPARRGVFDGGPLTVASSAPFGVGTARRRLEASGRVVVHPRIVTLRGLSVLDRPARPEQAPRTVPRHGSGQDFLGVREYRTGDSLRHVHWPSSARHGTLIVREFDREEPRRLGILVDTWADSSPEDPETALDVCCAAAGSAALRALALGGSVGVAAAIEAAVQVLPRAGEGELLEWLAALRAPGRAGVERLAEAVELLGRPEALLLVAPSWAANVDRIPWVAAALAEAGAQVQVLIVDAASFTAGREPAAGAAAARRMAGPEGSVLGAGGDLAGALDLTEAETVSR